MNQFEYSRATTVRSALSALSKDKQAMFLAGGTNLVDLMKKGVSRPSRLVDINELPLAGVEQTPMGLRIGALARNSDVAGHALVARYFPLLSMALKAGASPQLRNMATVGGNMMQRTRCGYFYDTAMPCNKREPGTGCSAVGGYNRMHAIFGASEQCIAVHPSDMCVALTALDATVTITGEKGERKMAFADFHRLPGNTPEKDNNLQKGELITAVDIPFNSFAKHSRYLKIRDRASYAFALVSVAAALDIQDGMVRDARLAMGGVAHKPWRLYDMENALKGQPATEPVFRETAETAILRAKSYGHNDFKKILAARTIAEALKATIIDH